MKKNSFIRLLTVPVLILSVVMLFSCKSDELYNLYTSDELLIGKYLEKNDSIYSSFTSVLEKTGNLSFLKAYGAYTCFIPTNEAMDMYLKKHGKNSVSDFSQEELTALVKYHIIPDTINSTLFSDGKLPSPNLYGHYLTTKAYISQNKQGGTDFVYKINKYAEIISLDKRFPNGLIHTINEVIEPVKKSVVQLYEDDSAYSIFNKALKETGLYNVLNKVSTQDVPVDQRVWNTLFIQSDATYKKAGIQSYESLKAIYSNTGNPANPKDSLYLYMAYHCLPNNLEYVADLIMKQAHVTLAPLEVITIKLDGVTVLINEDIFNGVTEKGYSIDRDNSDNTAANGVVHIVNGNFFIKARVPFAVYWDVCDQPELIKNTAVFRKIGQTQTYGPGSLAGITWSSQNLITYVCTGGPEDEFVHYDYWSIMLRTAVIPWVEFTTPLLVKGKYKVWTGTRNVYGGRRPKFLVTFDGDQQMPTVIDNNYTIPRDPRYETDEELEARGFKRYNYVLADSSEYFTLWKGVFVGQLAGTIDVLTTGTHKIRFDVLNNADGGMWLDQIHFIPVDADQIWPRVKLDGTLIYAPEVPFPHEKTSSSSQ
jgi:uncharacterized surface protein with fasciclin (FAS1) repeats